MRRMKIGEKKFLMLIIHMKPDQEPELVPELVPELEPELEPGAGEPTVNGPSPQRCNTV